MALGKRIQTLHFCCTQQGQRCSGLMVDSLCSANNVFPQALQPHILLAFWLPLWVPASSVCSLALPLCEHFNDSVWAPPLFLFYVLFLFIILCFNSHLYQGTWPQIPNGVRQVMKWVTHTRKKASIYQKQNHLPFIFTEQRQKYLTWYRHDGYWK